MSEMKTDKAYLGLVDLINWVSDVTLDCTNDFSNIHDFVDYLVVDRLYTENYLKRATKLGKE